MTDFHVRIYSIEDIIKPIIKDEITIVAEDKAKAACLAHEYADEHFPNMKKVVETRSNY